MNLLVPDHDMYYVSYCVGDSSNPPLLISVAGLLHTMVLGYYGNKAISSEVRAEWYDWPDTVMYMNPLTRLLIGT